MSSTMDFTLLAFALAGVGLSRAQGLRRPSSAGRSFPARRRRSPRRESARPCRPSLDVIVGERDFRQSERLAFEAVRGGVGGLVLPLKEDPAAQRGEDDDGKNELLVGLHVLKTSRGDTCPSLPAACASGRARRTRRTWPFGTPSDSVHWTPDCSLPRAALYSSSFLRMDASSSSAAIFGLATSRYVRLGSLISLALAASRSASPLIQSSVFFMLRMVFVRYRFAYCPAIMRSSRSPPAPPNIANCAPRSGPLPEQANGFVVEQLDDTMARALATVEEQRPGLLGCLHPACRQRRSSSLPSATAAMTRWSNGGFGCTTRTHLHVDRRFGRTRFRAACVVRATA